VFLCIPVCAHVLLTVIVEKVSVVTKEPANNPGEAEGAQEMPVLIPFPVLPGSFVCLQEMPVVALHSVVLLPFRWEP
jgi:hypothetical protein